MSDTVPPESPPPNRLKKTAHDSGVEGKTDQKKKPTPKPGEAAVSSKGKLAAGKLRDKEKNLDRTPRPAEDSAGSSDKSKSLADSKAGSRSDHKKAGGLSDSKAAADKAAKGEKGDKAEKLEKYERLDKHDADEKTPRQADSKDGSEGDEAAAGADSPEGDEEAGDAPADGDESDAEDERDGARNDRDDAEEKDAAVEVSLPREAALAALAALPDTPPDEDERFHAMCAWLSAAALVLLMVCPLYFMGPLLYWLRYRTRSHFVSFHAKQALWWSGAATVLLVGLLVVSGMLFSGWLGGEYAGLNLFTLVPFQVPVILWFAWVGLKALQGVKYKTPVVGNMAEANPQKLL